MWQPFGICKLPVPGGMAGPQPGENVGPWDLCRVVYQPSLLMYRYWCEENENFYLAKATISVQSLSRVQLFATPWTVACQASLSINNSLSLLKFISIKSVRPSNHLIFSCPLLSSMFPSIRVFSKEFFTSGGQSIGVSASVSVLPVNIQDWFPLGWTGWFLQSRGLSRVFSNTTVQKPLFRASYSQIELILHLKTCALPIFFCLRCVFSVSVWLTHSHPSAFNSGIISDQHSLASVPKVAPFRIFLTHGPLFS